MNSSEAINQQTKGGTGAMMGGISQETANRFLKDPTQIGTQ